MVRLLVLLIMGALWIISGAEARYNITLEVSREQGQGVVKPKKPRESLLFRETLNMHIVSLQPVVAKSQMLFCYVGTRHWQTPFYFSDFIEESKTDKNSYFLRSNILVNKDMNGTWYCNLQYDADSIEFELNVDVGDAQDLFRNPKGEIATMMHFERCRENKLCRLQLTNRYRNETTSGTIKYYTYENRKVPQITNINGTSSKISILELGTIGYDAESHSNETDSDRNKHNNGYQRQNRHLYVTTAKTKEFGTYIDDAKPHFKESANNTNKHHYGYGAGTQKRHLSGTTSKPKNGPHSYVDNRNNFEQLENVEKDNDESTDNVKIIVIIALCAGSGILICTIVGVICRKKFKTPDKEPIASFTTDDPVYDDVYSAELRVDVTNRPPHPLPFEESDENKKYIHYDTPYDHRFEGRRLPCHT